ncbi:MAG: YidC/Oxa1 family insertase periplasmic-domain containing protein, partial [Bacteroidota bacterium]
MEEKKLDINSIIGFVLIFGILLWIMYQQAPTAEEVEAQKQAEQEQIEAEKKAKEAEQNSTLVTSSEDFSNASATDSLQRVELQSKLGAFAYAATLPSATDNETTVNTGVFELKFNNKGGHLSQVKLVKFVDYDSMPIYIVKDGNADFNITFGTTDNRILNTRDQYFQPTVT